jgi:hypothetical protein
MPEKPPFILMAPADTFFLTFFSWHRGHSSTVLLVETNSSNWCWHELHSNSNRGMPYSDFSNYFLHYVAYDWWTYIKTNSPKFYQIGHRCQLLTISNPLCKRRYLYTMDDECTGHFKIRSIFNSSHPV